MGVPSFNLTGPFKTKKMASLVAMMQEIGMAAKMEEMEVLAKMEAQ